MEEMMELARKFPRLGKVEGIRENAQKMKQAGISPEQISGITGLSGGEIENL
jgi:hypothetical protein